MGKKIANDLNVISPKKDFMSDKPGMMSGHQENNPNMDNMNPIPNDNKKSMKEGQTGSQTKKDNPKIEEERENVNVNGFEEQPPNDIQEENIEKAEDAISRASKKDSEYIKFFKFYYENTKKQHPNWSPGQVTTIVSLLWKKKKSHQKSSPSEIGSKNSRRSNKPLAPKDAFRMEHKNLTKEELDQLWAKLPKESKNFWKKEGQNYCTLSTKSSDISSVKNCKNLPPIYNAMRTLLKQV